MPGIKKRVSAVICGICVVCGVCNDACGAVAVGRGATAGASGGVRGSSKDRAGGATIFSATNGVPNLDALYAEYLLKSNTLRVPAFAMLLYVVSEISSGV